MPLARYLLRNEFCLSDPELYKAADKNDPEALLEGVAMAGLVGVLRQLGDLAEFAAGIFSDLHEEVMATASRGHRLKVRVQQLEAEFPSVEKAFLSQTNHSLLLYNEGIDWHPNLQMSQNLITSGDLPHSVMDSYEECRGPPRLFLLDKFDNAGLGACLKRYSDPSFFKAEVSSFESKKADTRKEKKARKIRRKGSQWRIRETAEGSARSHAKLHQLFSKERQQTDTNLPTNRVKLKKRQFNRLLFDSISGKSYMERFLESRLPERLKSSNFSELSYEGLELSTQDSANQLVIRDRDLVSSPTSHEKILEMCMDELDEDVIEEELKKLSSPTPNFNKLVDRKVDVMVSKENKGEGKIDGYRSDDLTSEVDNYVDALTTMESEMETDTECRTMNEQGFFHTERMRMGSNKSEDLQEVQGGFSDSQSVENSSVSDDGTNSFRKGRSSFSYSDTPSSSAGHVLSDGDVAAKPDPSTETVRREVVDLSSAKFCENGDTLGTGPSEHRVSFGASSEASGFPSYISGRGELSRESSLTNSSFTVSQISSKESESKCKAVRSDYVESPSSYQKDCKLSTTSNGDNNFSRNVSHQVDFSYFPSHMVDDALPVTSGEALPDVYLDGGIHDESSGYLLQSVNVSNLTPGKRDSDDTLKEIRGEEYSDDSSSLGNVSHFVSLPTEESHNNLTRKDLETGSPIAPPPDFLELNFPDVSNKVPASKMVGTTTSEIERSFNSMKVSSECTLCPPPNQASETEVHLQLADSESELSCEAYDTQNVVGYDKVALSSENHTNLQEGCRSQIEDLFPDKCVARNEDSGQFKVEMPNPFSSEDITGSDAQKEAVIPDPVSPSELKFMISDPEFYDPCASKLLGSVVLLKDQSDLHPSDDIGVATSLRRWDQESELIKSQNTDLTGSANDASFPSTIHKLLDLSLPNPDVPEVNVTEIPPLPPLPPIQWRTGKLQHPPVPLERETVQCSLNPFSPTTLSEKAQWCLPELDFELEQSLNPFLPMSNEKLLDVSLRDKDMGTASLNPFSPPVLTDGDDNISQEFLKLERVAQPLNPFLSSGTESQNFSYCSLHLGVHSDSIEFSQIPSRENLTAPHISLYCEDQQNLKSLAAVQDREEEMSEDTHGLAPSPGNADADCIESSPAPSNEVENVQPSSLSVDDEAEQRLNSQSPVQNREEETSQDNYRFAPSPSIADADCIELSPTPSNEVENAEPSFLSADVDQTFNSQPLLPDREQDVSQNTRDFASSPSNSDVKADSIEVSQIPCNDVVNAQPSFLNSSSAVEHNSNPLLPSSIQDREEEKYQDTHGYAPSPNNAVVSGENSSLNIEDELISPSAIQDTKDTRPCAALTSEEEKLQPLCLFKPCSAVEDEKPASSGEDEELPSMMEDEKQTWVVQNEKSQHASFSLEREMIWHPDFSSMMPPTEEEKPIGIRKAWLHRPRDPLIQAVASHDKSTLRKVSERVQPQTETKADERDSLLEQIRAQSFSLKPTVLTRPNIQAPKSNLRVSAILEKANAIRQALAGSDEDDDSESWSDS
ncbi:protein SCAR2-like isoform X2 [Papaver somniferum]|uniref:protein SCAR2-like isoform X2 n=1 Tax=Papaver somniferum TaxID=3469 RepID=UPI000E6FB4DB|nr:protein SCAR2-like isoform X2 [Papaver somniferum]